MKRRVIFSLLVLFLAPNSLADYVFDPITGFAHYTESHTITGYDPYTGHMVYSTPSGAVIRTEYARHATAAAQYGTYPATDAAVQYGTYPHAVGSLDAYPHRHPAEYPGLYTSTHPSYPYTHPFYTSNQPWFPDNPPTYYYTNQPYYRMHHAYNPNYGVTANYVHRYYYFSNQPHYYHPALVHYAHPNLMPHPFYNPAWHRICIDNGISTFCQ